MDTVKIGIQSCFSALKEDFFKEFSVGLTTVGF